MMGLESRAALYVQYSTYAQGWISELRPAVKSSRFRKAEQSRTEAESYLLWSKRPEVEAEMADQCHTVAYG